MTAKEQLTTFIVYAMNEAQCARILQKLAERANTPWSAETSMAMASATWDESKHPRADDGKFTSGPGYGGSTNNRVDRISGPTPQEHLRMQNDLKLSRPPTHKNERPTQKRGEIDLEIVREHQRRVDTKSTLADCEKAEKEAREAMKKAKRVGGEAYKKAQNAWRNARDETKRARKNEAKYDDAQRRMDRYRSFSADLENEIADMEERYGVKKNGEPNFDTSQRGQSDRQKYKKMQREYTRLNDYIYGNSEQEDDANPYEDHEDAQRYEQPEDVRYSADYLPWDEEAEDYRRAGEG